MRHRLAESVRYLVSQAAGELDLARDQLESFLARVETGPVSPHAFGAYYDLVLALDQDDLDEAELHLTAMLGAAPQPELRIAALGDGASQPDVDRVRRHVDTDRGLPLEIFSPGPEAAASCQRRIQEALELIDSANPELRGEIDALVREIVLAVGSSAPGALRFDGASCFMLWGAILVNPDSHQTVLEMVQALAHESAHSLLFGLAVDGPLALNDDDPRFVSPLRADPRPIDGILHATYVTARMHQAVARLLEADALAGSPRDEATRALGEHAANFAHGIQILDCHARLTPVGDAALSDARAYMDRAKRGVDG
jgi:HEXXH motif-containing protein